MSRDSCYGEFYDDADELIEEVLKENGIQREDAAKQRGACKLHFYKPKK